MCVCVCVCVCVYPGAVQTKRDFFYTGHSGPSEEQVAAGHTLNRYNQNNCDTFHDSSPTFWNTRTRIKPFRKPDTDALVSASRYKGTGIDGYGFHCI
jgi:hypothetical protein